MSEMVYHWKSGSRVKIDARKAGRRMEKLRKKNKDHLTTSVVVDDARAKTSPLHDHFEWSDARAADAYRNEQAGYLIRCLMVTGSLSEGSEETITRAFVSVVRDDDRSYTSIVHAMSDDELRRQVVETAWRELGVWRDRYQEYKELADIFNAMDATTLVEIAS